VHHCRQQSMRRHKHSAPPSQASSSSGSQNTRRVAPARWREDAKREPMAGGGTQDSAGRASPWSRLLAPWLVGAMVLGAFSAGAGWATVGRTSDTCMVESSPAQLDGCSPSQGDLDGVDLRRARLRGADLSGLDLSERDLRGAHLEGAILRGADLSNARLEGAYLNGADLSGAILDGLCIRTVRSPGPIDGVAVTAAGVAGTCPP